MRIRSETNSVTRKPTNLTIRKDVLEEAKSLNLNTSKAAEFGIVQAIRELKSKEWVEHNQVAISAHNERIAKQGVLLKPKWDNR
ncbi:type II toxin-antitoxin system CcdA family antitoxin [Ekhidna sp.]|jgi:antitoxin CcdA|uniref:type II toxin-antitoxin system CcdA family antitoxin n=1 Tax=Ekhidna sp. TaxID=2608089 RepID=UPI0032EFCAC0